MLMKGSAPAAEAVGATGKLRPKFGRVNIEHQRRHQLNNLADYMADGGSLLGYACIHALGIGQVRRLWSEVQTAFGEQAA